MAELHIGLGVSSQTGGVADSIFEASMKDLRLVADRTGARHLIVNGDLKESIGAPRIHELDLLRRFEKLAFELFEDVVLVKGNHDGLIEKYVGFKVVPSYSFIEDEVEVNVQHGHIIKPSGDMLVLAHMHPSVGLPDGSRVFAWIFLRRIKASGKGVKSVVVMPPFNRFVGGGSIENTDLLKRLGIKLEKWESRVIGVNGLFFGGLERFVSER